VAQLATTTASNQGQASRLDQKIHFPQTTVRAIRLAIRYMFRNAERRGVSADAPRAGRKSPGFSELRYLRLG